jgi:FKBP-type peptidyl-prolyl cis-trans isomerase SlpA
MEGLLLGLTAGADDQVLADGDALFGPWLEENLHWMAREDFSADLAPEVGQVVAFETPAGDEIAGVVRQVEEQRVEVDFNHPLAGRPLRIRIRVLEVWPAAAGGPSH